MWAMKMKNNDFRALIFAVTLLLAPLCFAQEPLDLPQAISVARETSPERKMALADTRIARARVSFAKSDFFPRITFTETASVGNDPVYVFGSKLRGARFGSADFATARLNHPEPIGDFSSRVSGQWNVFDSFGKTYRLRSAKSTTLAADKQLSRADQELIFRVLDSYYSIGVSRKQLEVSEQLVKTAEAVLDSSTTRVEAGSAVESDALSARVNLLNRQQDLIRARSNLQVAFTQFETALGASIAPGQQPIADLIEQTLKPASLSESEALALQQRPDLAAIAAQVDSQRHRVRAAQSTYAPRLDIYGSWQSDRAATFSNGNNSWVTGAELRVDLLSRDREANLSSENASLARTEAAKRQAENNVRLDVRKAWFEHDSSRQMLDVSRASVRQAEESLRMVRDRYESGLATITDLLRAEDADRTSRMNYWQSVYRYIVSYAALELASGELTTQSPVVTQ
jgi:outer membrane protein TolC